MKEFEAEYAVLTAEAERLRIAFVEAKQKANAVGNAWDQEFFARQNIAKQMAKCCNPGFQASYYLPWCDEGDKWIYQDSPIWGIPY